MEILQTSLRDHSKSLSPLTPFSYRIFRRNPWLFQAVLAGDAELPELSDNQVFAELVAEQAFGDHLEMSFASLDFRNRRSDDYKKQAAKAIEDGRYPILKDQVIRASLLGEVVCQNPYIQERLADSVVFPAGTELRSSYADSLPICSRPAVVMEDIFVVVKVLRSFEDMSTAARVGRWIEQLCFHATCIEGDQTPAILAVEDSEAPRTRLVKLNIGPVISSFREILDEYISGEWRDCQHIVDCRTVRDLHTWRVFEP